METEEKFEGLTVTLKKRKMCVEGGNISQEFSGNNYLVLGHFDQMSIKYVNSWSQWAPFHTESVSLNDEYIDKYNIKAYFPESKIRAKYQEKGVTYEIWKEQVDEFPFVIACVVNISIEYASELLKDKKDVNDCFIDLVCKCAKDCSQAEEGKNIHMSVCPTIGYSDFLLLFRTNDINYVLRLIENLKCQGNQKKPYISDIYTLVGFCNKGLENLKNNISKGIEISIRFALKEGVSANQFKNILDKELGSGWGRSYRVLGDSDFMLVTNAEFSQVLPLYFNNGTPGPLCPGSTVFKYIRNMQSELCISDIGAMKNVTSYFPDENNDLIEQYRERFSVNLEKLKDFLRKNRLPGRIVYGLQIVMKRFLQLIRTKHSFDVERIVGNVFDNFFNCVIRSIDDINYIDTKINGNSEVEKMKYDYLQKFLKALNFFREKVGDYLADMQRSDSLFLEGRSLSHPSIGSATKLLFFYNWYINRVKEKIDVENADRYSFLVMSGGTDQTQAIDLFAYLDPADKACSVILITVPEASLYDVKSSLFHVLHELLHFCGERKRKERWKYITEALSTYTGIVFGDFLEKDQEGFIYVCLEQLQVYKGADSYAELKKKVEGEVASATNILKKNLAKELNDRIAKNSDDALYYGRYVYEEIYKSVSRLFDEEQPDLINRIYELYLEYQKELMQSISSVLEKEGILYSMIHLNVETVHYKLLDVKDKKYNVHDMNLIKKIVAYYLGRKNSEDSEEFSFDELDSKIALSEILGTLSDLFKECYADCMAGKILDIKTSQFIYSFLTETRNEQDAFSNDNISRLRMLIDFKYMFGIENNVPDNVNQELKKLLDGEEKKITCYVRPDQAIKWVNTILEKRGEEERISALIDPVIKYLYICNSDWNVKGEEAISELRYLNNYSEMKTDADVYSFLHYVSDSWIFYAKLQEE